MTTEELKEIKDLLPSIATDAVAAYVKEAGLDKVDQKYVIIPKADADGKDEKEQLKQTMNEKFGTLAKAVWKKDFVKIREIQSELVELKAADPNNMTTTTEGGYLVPDVTSAEIIGLIPTYGQARGLVDVGEFPLGVDNLLIPKEGTGLTVYYPGENAAITASKLTLDILTLACKKATGLAVLTNELNAFGIVSFANYIKKKAAQAFGTDEDSKVFGKVNTVFTGLFYPSNAFGDDETADPDAITYEQLNHMIYSLDQNYFKGASWVMHRTIVEKVRNVKDDNNRPIFNDANSGGLPSLLSYPVNIVENAPSYSSLSAGDPFIFFGNPKYSMLKDKQGMRIELFNEGTVASTSMLENDLTAIRFIRHWMFHPGLVEAYSVLKKAGV